MCLCRLANSCQLMLVIGLKVSFHQQWIQQEKFCPPFIFNEGTQRNVQGNVGRCAARILLEEREKKLSSALCKFKAKESIGAKRRLWSKPYARSWHDSTKRSGTRLEVKILHYRASKSAQDTMATTKPGFNLGRPLHTHNELLRHTTRYMSPMLTCHSLSTSKVRCSSDLFLHHCHWFIGLHCRNS